MITVQTHYDNEWTTVVSFHIPLPTCTIVNVALSINNDPRIPHDDVAIVEGSTGEVIWNANSVDDYDEPIDIDSDMGFDPYMGCFSDDC